MNVRLCDNCNEIAAVENQDCISLELPYDIRRHFCTQKCLIEYTEKLKKHELSSKEYELKEKIESILGKENIEKVNELISNAIHINYSIEKRCIYKMLMGMFLE